MNAKGVMQSLCTYPDDAHLTTELRQALRRTLFSSGLRISPRRVNQIGQEIAAAFLKFLETEDEEAARTYGERLAAEGLGHRSILTMAEALRQVCRESANPEARRPVAGRYVNALLEGYMVGREASVLQEQARTMRALQRAQAPRTNTRPI
jgi:hypothetical protein